MKLRLTKEFAFEMAHALTGYDGKCSNLHGHNYRLFVTVEGEPIADPNSAQKGMVVDFGELKRIVEQTIVEPFDHALVISADSPFNTGLPTKTMVVDFQPTSENLLMHFAQLLEGKLPANAKLYSMKLYETETSCAELIV